MGKKITLANNFYFSKVMHDNPDICAELLKLIIEEDPGNLTEVDIEKYIKELQDSHGVCLDLFLMNDKDEMFDMEMQQYLQVFLEKRMRYYVANMDIASLKPGEDYGKLKRAFIIFICNYDHCGKGESIYHFCLMPDQKGSGAFLNLGVNFIILNTLGRRDKISVDLGSVLDLMEGKEPSTEFAGRINKALLKAEREGKGNDMKYEADLVNAKYLGYNEGEADGIEKGRAQGIEEGETQANYNFARYLIRQNLSYEEVIKEIPAFTKEDYDKIKEDLA